MIVVGIDPGLSGAIATLYPNRDPAIDDMPTRPTRGNGMIKHEVFARGVRDVIRARVPAAESVLFAIEDVGIMGGHNNSLQTQGSLVRSFCVAQAVAELRTGPDTVECVNSRTWKAFYGLGKDKAEALRIARELFPSLETSLARAKDQNRAEALLIANFAQRTLA